MPSYNPDSYLIKNDFRSLEAIADTTCRNEVIHLVICLLSFVPIIFTAFFGAAPLAWPRSGRTEPKPWNVT